MGLLEQTYLSDILHIVSQALLVPAIVALLGLMLYGLWCIGSIIVEAVTERRHFSIVMPSFLAALVDAAPGSIPDVIRHSGLLGNQKRALLTLWDFRTLPAEAHMALAKRVIDEYDGWLRVKVQRTESVAKIAPMLGLMGTLIPLGPGIVSLGQGDTLTLSTSLLVAFDTTVAGLVVAVVAFIISKIRKRWYENYMTALEAGMTAILEKVDTMRAEGTIDVVEPTAFAEAYTARR